MQRQRFELSTRELALIFLFWTALAAISTANRLLDARELADLGIGRVMRPAGPIALAFLESWTWAAFTPVIFWLSSRSDLTRSRLLRVLMLVAAGIAIAIAVDLLLDFARSQLIFMPRRRRAVAPVFAPLRAIGRFRFVNQLLVYAAVLATGLAREFFLRDRARQQHEARLQAQLAEARLDALRMQLNPHFLFNTLHAVSALVERDPGGVRRMIARLSELLRHTIDSRATDEVPLREELAFLRRYVEIMEVRFQGRLQVRVDAATDTLEALVPNLVLQPIVENALEHGAAQAEGEGRIEVTSRRVGNDLVLTVRDNGPGVRGDTSSGVGLRNTRARLEQLYGEFASFTLKTTAERTEAQRHGDTEEDEEGTFATIVLPFREAHRA